VSDAITPQSRVTHIADRNRDVPRPGTVEAVWTDANGTYARVRWDSEAIPATHPAANLVPAT
jgi:hypothetical protein